MPRVDQRGTVWFYVLLVLMIVGGFCAIGYYQTYNINCGGYVAKTWVWTKFPPGFECKAF